MLVDTQTQVQIQPCLKEKHQLTFKLHTTFQKLLLDNLQVQVWVQSASAWGARCTHHTDVEGWVAKLGSCEVQGAELGSCIHSRCVPTIWLVVVTVSHGYQGNRTSPSVLCVPPQVVNRVHCIIALKCAILSLQNHQGWRTLFHLAFATHTCSKSKERSERQLTHLYCFLICISYSSPERIPAEP